MISAQQHFADQNYGLVGSHTETENLTKIQETVDAIRAILDLNPDNNLRITSETLKPAKGTPPEIRISLFKYDFENGESAEEVQRDYSVAIKDSYLEVAHIKFSIPLQSSFSTDKEGTLNAHKGTITRFLYVQDLAEFIFKTAKTYMGQANVEKLGDLIAISGAETELLPTAKREFPVIKSGLTQLTELYKALDIILNETTNGAVRAGYDVSTSTNSFWIERTQPPVGEKIEDKNNSYTDPDKIIWKPEISRPKDMHYLVDATHHKLLVAQEDNHTLEYSDAIINYQLHVNAENMMMITMEQIQKWTDKGDNIKAALRPLTESAFPRSAKLSPAADVYNLG